MSSDLFWHLCQHAVMRPFHNFLIIIYISIFLTELPTVVTKLKEVIGQITLQTSPTASTSATPSTSVDSASVSPQVLSDDMVSTTHASVTVHVGR